MKKFTLLAAFALLAQIATAQENVARLTLLSAYDLDGEAADDDQIVTSATLADSTTFTIAAQPDVCRLIDMTIADGDSSITAGTVTVTGTDCLGYARVCTFDFSVVATRGSGVKTLPVTTGPPGASCYLGAVTSVISSALTGEGGAGDTIKVGYTTNSANGWALYGKLKPTGPSGEHGVDPFGSYEVNAKITTSASCSNTVTGVVGADDPYLNVSAGDLLIFNVRDSYGQLATYERKVTARASADSVTIGGACVNIPAAGVTFRFKKQYYSTDPTDQMWLAVNGWKSLMLNYSVDSNTDTGGVVATLECIDGAGPDFPSGKWVQIDTVTTATGNTLSPTATALGPVLLDQTAFSFCRVALKFGTGDDDDTGVEDINLSATLSK